MMLEVAGGWGSPKRNLVDLAVASYPRELPTDGLCRLFFGSLLRIQQFHKFWKAKNGATSSRSKENGGTSERQASKAGCPSLCHATPDIVILTHK